MSSFMTAILGKSSRGFAILLLVCLFAITLLSINGCSDNDRSYEELSGTWTATFEMSFGETGNASLEMVIDNPYPASIQGSAFYNGPDGFGDVFFCEGILSGWRQGNDIVFYFVEPVDSNFTIQCNGYLSENMMSGNFSVFIRDQTWFFGSFTAVKSGSSNASRQESLPIPRSSLSPLLAVQGFHPSDQSWFKGGPAAVSEAGDQCELFEDFESLADCYGFSKSLFCYQGEAAGLWLPSQVSSVGFTMDLHQTDWSTFTRLEFWMWNENIPQDADLVVEFSLGQGRGERFVVTATLSMEGTQDRWNRMVCYLSDAVPSQPATRFSDVQAFSLRLEAGGDSLQGARMTIDQVRLCNDRWFFDFMLENGEIVSHMPDGEQLVSEVTAGYYGAALARMCEWLRFERGGPFYDDPTTGFTVELDNCYADYRFPFPPFSCESDDTVFRLPEQNYNIDWLRWETYGRDEIAHAETRYLFWQWNERLNRHYILAKLAAGISSTADVDSQGASLTDEARTNWRRAYKELLADWLYDFPDPGGTFGWGDVTFTVLSDITTAIRIEQWMKMLELLRNDRESLPDWLYFDCLKLLARQAEATNATLAASWQPTNRTAMLGFLMYTLGMLHPEFPDGGIPWRENGIAAMHGLAYADGGAVEGSTHYHTVTLNFLNHMFSLAAFNDSLSGSHYLIELEPLIPERLAMHRFLWELVQPVSTDSPEYLVPAFNDGIGMGVGVGSYIDWYSDYGSSPFLPSESVHLQDSGLICLRSDGSPAAVYLLFDVAPFGAGAHGHQDKLNFTLDAGGHHILCDPGGWGGANLDWDRTAMHNSITVDDYGQIRPYVDDYTEDGTAVIYEVSDNRSEIGGVYSAGYGYFYEGVSHRMNSTIHDRRIVLNSNGSSPFIEVTDTMTASDLFQHHYRVYFHFHPDEAAFATDLSIDTHRITTSQHHSILEATSLNGTWTTENRLITDSHQYGNVRSAAVACYTVAATGRTTVITFRLTPLPDS